ncbi:MAG: hypothetical protein CVU05_12115 [Bacteroidetes bacterium HGW-Bacteroidetes-21]|jgi:hypothetical protein|nr:MAG: hypothetical protein CVU05_12115 [Bacteroidetes bacterium HGW-Bacteroidetes-21]
MKRVVITIAIFQFLLAGLSSCDKDPLETKPSVDPLVSYLASTNALNDVFLTFNYYYPEDFTNTILQNGVEMTVTPVYPLDSFPKIIYIDFGETGILCADSITRKGIITCAVASPWDEFPSSVKLSFDHYYSNNVLIDGHFEFVSTRVNDSILFNLNVLNGKLVLENNDSIKFNCSFPLRTEFQSMFKVLEPFSWEALTSQEFSGVDNKQSPFQVNIEQILKFSNTCENGEIVSGKVNVIPDGASDFQADFGNGDCDRTLIISSGGINFTLPF